MVYHGISWYIYICLLVLNHFDAWDFLLLALQLMAGQIALMAGPSATWNRDITWAKRGIGTTALKLEKTHKDTMKSSWPPFHRCTLSIFDPKKTLQKHGQRWCSHDPQPDELFGLQIIACIGTAHVESRGQTQLQLRRLPAVRGKVTPGPWTDRIYSTKRGYSHERNG